jgi:hypothetical protein
MEFMCDDIEEITGIKVNCPVNEKGHEVLFITPSGDIFADPGTYTYMGYLMLFHEIGWTTPGPPTPPRAATSACSRPTG